MTSVPDFAPLFRDTDAPRPLVAFSGGADSTALLHMLSKQYPVTAVHVHHGIRGAEADRDAAFCVSLCEREGIPCTVLYADVPAMARASGRSIEEEARHARYGLLADFLRKHPALTHLCTAHHADDQAETVLFRLLRGTSQRGLMGIPQRRLFSIGERQVPLVRPLLSLTGDDILAYCAKEGLSYVTDSSNFENDCARNRIRNVLIPEARTINPDFSGALLRLSRDASRDEDFFDTLLAPYMAEMAGGKPISLSTLRCLHPALRTRLLLRLYGDAIIRLTGMKEADAPLSHALLDAACAQLTQGEAPRSLDLPGGLLLSVFPAGDTVSFSLQSDAGNTPPSFDLPLSENEPLCLPDGTCCLRAVGKKGEALIKDLKNIYKFVISATINSDTIEGYVRVRSRKGRSEDRYLCGGSRKTAKDALSSHKVPPAMRQRIPLFCDDGGIMYIPFCGIRDSVNPRYKTKEIIKTEVLCYFYTTV